MHSRIFQITKEPIPQDEWLTHDDIVDTWFIGEIADYVAESDRAEDIAWLKETTKGVFEVLDEGDQIKIKFLPGGKKEHFGERFHDLKEAVEQLTLEQFCNDGMEEYNIRTLVLDRFSFYVYDDERGLIPLDTFIRRGEEGIEYYLGGTVDYHY
jgi:hypothetical protein